MLWLSWSHDKWVGEEGGGGKGLLSSPMFVSAFSHKNIFQIKTYIGKIYIIECMIYLSLYHGNDSA